MDLQQIGKYGIVSEIGRGMMGRVYRAHDPILNRYVAIKTVSAALGTGGETLKRFQREAQAAALLSHPNIVTVHDFGEEQGLIYMAMELLEGVDLREAIDRNLLPGFEDKIRVMEQICAGLAFAHAKGVVHRDLKPANVHIQPNGQVKIVDFGLARLNTSDMTQEGIVLGTPTYMSPEQALGDKVDARSDIFSAGAVFYELLTGHKPFDAESTHGVLFQVVHKEPVSIRRWTPGTPRVLVEVVEKALVKDKKLRLQTARQMGAALAVARQALDAGRGPDASLAEESQRALKEASLRLEPDLRPSAPSSSTSRPHWVEGTVALDMTPASSPPQQAAIPGAAAASARRRVGPRRSARPLPKLMLAAGTIAVAGLAAGAVVWLRAPAPAPASDSPGTASNTSAAELSALTHALVETQLQLARRELEDKSYTAAADQAERVLKLDAGNVEARAILEEAGLLSAEIQAAVADARTALETGDSEAASQALARVLELDPRHEAAHELAAQLNSTFRSRAEAAEGSMKAARADAERAQAGASPDFGEAGRPGRRGSPHTRAERDARAALRGHEHHDQHAERRRRPGGVRDRRRAQAARARLRGPARVRVAPGGRRRGRAVRRVRLPGQRGTQARARAWAGGGDDRERHAQRHCGRASQQRGAAPAARVAGRGARRVACHGQLVELRGSGHLGPRRDRCGTAQLGVRHPP
jgi:serine/threonine protein kinase